MSKPSTLAVLSMICLVLAACTPGLGPAQSGVPLEGTSWNLLSYTDVQGNMASVLPGTEITVRFQDGEVGGPTGCNTYFGTYKVDGAKLTVEVGGLTQMFCEGVMDQEQAYLAALGSVAAYQITGDKLEMTRADGTRVLTCMAK